MRAVEGLTLRLDESSPAPTLIAWKVSEDSSPRPTFRKMALRLMEGALDLL